MECSEKPRDRYTQNVETENSGEDRKSKSFSLPVQSSSGYEVENQSASAGCKSGADDHCVESKHKTS